jgi:dihydroorotate dehydrogenase electron transfer subunit
MSAAPSKKVQTFSAKVQSLQHLGGNTYLLNVKAPTSGIEGLGRFARLRAWPEPSKISSMAGPLLDRPFSIHRVKGQSLDVLIREVGLGTSILSHLNQNEELKFTGPLGRGLDELCSDFSLQSWYLVAGGAGLGPMASLADRLGSKAQLFYGEKTGSAQVDQQWLQSWAPDFVATTEDGQGYGSAGLITKPLALALAQQPRPIFACGPLPMLEAVVRLASQSPVWVCLEARMACGLGVCLSCSLPKSGGGKVHVCVDGPIFPAPAIQWSSHG